MGIISKGTKCSIVDCQNDGIRSLSITKLTGSSLDVLSNKKNVVLCKTHYKKWKKNTKKTRLLERSRYNSFQ